MKIVNQWFQAKVTFVQNISSLTHLLEERKTTSVKKILTTNRQLLQFSRNKKKKMQSLQRFPNLKGNKKNERKC